MTAKLRELLQSLNLPGSLQALEKPLGLPPSLLSHAEEIRQQEGLNRLRLSIKDTSKLKANDKAIYTEGVEMLMAEKDEDNRARTKYGTDRWIREASEVAGEKLHARMKEIEGYLASAENSDRLVEEKLRDTERVLRVLNGTNREIETFVPSTRKAVMTDAVEREAVRLRGCLNEVSRLESRRRRRVEALREKAKGDSIHAALLVETGRLEREFPMQRIEASQFEDLFSARLQEYDVDRKMLGEDEEKAQAKIAEQLLEANRNFVNARRGDSSTKEREKALQELENGYVKYKEIIGNVEVGRKFYNDLAKLVGRFRDDCRGFVKERRIEAAELERDITNTIAMASLNISQIQKPKQKTSPPPATAVPTAPPAAVAAASAAIQQQQQQQQQQQIQQQPQYQSPPLQYRQPYYQNPCQKSPTKPIRSSTPGSYPIQTDFTPSTSTTSPVQTLASPTTPSRAPTEEPLVAPQPIRASIVPPPSTLPFPPPMPMPMLKSMPVAGMWSPERGIKFAGIPAPQMNEQTQRTREQAQAQSDVEAQEAQLRPPVPLTRQMAMPAPGQWDPSRGVRFS
ncbi:hypothetical protein PAAG_11857 [Paracoccidioides lutzii Pb01]|uniref:ALIX V-shaped domain-containing protein n=1 Tax=Paracoccidioides lutzii (strain ATCC MYA-826 / Pb01) TaxID=502779 RepID=A0A0A2VKH4_PARBA|nr:hypothetical protein PAAG_11857 [Paracoccidioides lutzii Pb01]KGQ01394.1 hypothetical protein PAAG_11857 [Paracoccidioides lutzii Pb01]